MRARPTATNPALMAIKGVGPVIGAQLLITAGDNPDRLRSFASFAALCGTALSRRGPTANPALHHIVKVHISYDPVERDYRDRHLEKGWTISAVFRTLKRAIVREISQALTGHCIVPDYSDLRPARRAKKPHPHRGAQHLEVWPSRIGELELGRRPNDDLAHRYREGLTAA